MKNDPRWITPPPDVLLDRVAFIPPIPLLFDKLFFPYYGSDYRPKWRQLEGWIVEGAPLCTFHKPSQWLSLSPSINFTVYSSIYGLMLPPYFTPRHGPGYGGGYQFDRDCPASAGNNLVAILLPATERVPETAESFYAELCERTSQHRDKLFWHPDLSDQPEPWRTKEAIDKFLRKTKDRRIVVKSLADAMSLKQEQSYCGDNQLALDQFHKNLEAVRQKFPTNF